jgi:hypothetical protein
MEGEQLFSQMFQALLKEALFTKEILGSGATQIRNANYATQGAYFQAFTSLSTGLERLGKLNLMLDYHIDHGKFPDIKQMKNEICHDISLIYKRSTTIIANRSFSMDFLPNLDDPIHQAIVRILSEFANGDRYSNIDLLTGSKRQSDPIASWYTQVDLPLFETHISTKKKAKIRQNAEAIAAVLGENSTVVHITETGNPITSLEDGSLRTGIYEAVCPYRQLYVLQVIRYFTEILLALQYVVRNDDLPHFSEIFGLFYNNDQYIRSRKTWESL